MSADRPNLPAVNTDFINHPQRNPIIGDNDAAAIVRRTSGAFDRVIVPTDILR
jgi:hypothetical protein